MELIGKNKKGNMFFNADVFEKVRNFHKCWFTNDFIDKSGAPISNFQGKDCCLLDQSGFLHTIANY